MHASGGGHIINIASMAVPGEAVYAASRHASIGFTLSLAADLQIAGRTDVKLSANCPDGIWTPMLHDRLDDPSAALSFSAKLLQPADVVRAVARGLDRARQVTAVPGWRLPLMRLADSFPELAFRGAAVDAGRPRAAAPLCPAARPGPNPDRLRSPGFGPVRRGGTTGPLDDDHPRHEGNQRHAADDGEHVGVHRWQAGHQARADDEVVAAVDDRRWPH